VCRTSFGVPVVPPVWKYAAVSSAAMRRPLVSRSDAYFGSNASKL
jgi:hypothetical protein